MDISVAADECFQTVRRHGPDRFIAGLFAPAERRAELWALYAFAHEIAKTARAVSEPMLGEIRLQWWRETIEGLFQGEIRAHPAALALAAPAGEGRLDRDWLIGAIDGHQFDLYETPMASRSALEDYAGATSGGIMRQAAALLSAEPLAPEAMAVIDDYAAAFAYGHLILSLPEQAAHRQIYLPPEYLPLDSAHGFFEARNSEAVRKGVLQLAETSQAHLLRARTEAKALPKEALPATLAASPVDLIVKRVLARGGAVFPQISAAAQFRRQWHIWRRAQSGLA